MLNQAEHSHSSQQRRMTRAPQQTERLAKIGGREAARVAAQSETAPEIMARELLIELDRLGRIVREIERALSEWDDADARVNSSTH